MASTKALDLSEDSSSPPIELRVRAEPGQLSVVRAVAATIAGQQDFDLDDIADVRLAIDEACSQLLVRAVSAGSLVCVFQTTPLGLRIRITTPLAANDAPTNQRSFGWHVLNTLTDSIEMTRDEDPTAPNGYTATIEFTKNRSGSDE